MSITIIKTGISTGIQDLGRWGYQQYGVPIGGAMDKVSASLANIICGNDEQEALIEMTLHGTSILFNEPACCALVGGGCRAYIDDSELPFNRLLHLPAYSMLTTTPAAAGCSSYLSVAGGLAITKELGSASTYAPSTIGGIEGRNLMKGDTIPFREPDRHSTTSAVRKLTNTIGVSPWRVPDIVPINNGPATIHVVRGPEFDLFSTHAQAMIFNTPFTVSPQSNRMGYRLEGPRLALMKQVEMVSTAVTAGVIQVTNEGAPIVLMADAQTTGGYPRIGRVCSADIPLLAQTRPGEQLRFREIDEQESMARFNTMQKSLSRINNGLRALEKG